MLQDLQTYLCQEKFICLNLILYADLCDGKPLY